MFLIAIHITARIKVSLSPACTACICFWIRLDYTAISRKVVEKSVRDNPERYCGWFWVHCSSEKFERIGTKGHEMRLRVLTWPAWLFPNFNAQFECLGIEYKSKPSAFWRHIVRYCFIYLSFFYYWIAPLIRNDRGRLGVKPNQPYVVQPLTSLLCLQAQPVEPISYCFLCLASKVSKFLKPITYKRRSPVLMYMKSKNYQTCNPATESKPQPKKLDKLGIFFRLVRLPMTTPLVLAN